MSANATLVLNEVAQTAQQLPRRARRTLLKRLVDIVAMPSSRIPPQDRCMAGDVLLEILFEAEDAERAFCARRLIPTQEAPRNVLRYLCLCSIEVCNELLEENSSLDDSDIRFILQRTTPAHAQAVARRSTLSPTVCDELVEFGDLEAITTMLTSRRAFLSETAIDGLLEISRDNHSLCGLLVNRPEMKPSHAMTMFWWCNAEDRQQVLMRYAADRSEMIDMCADVFSMAAEENWQDAVVRKTLQMLERRQRNRAAIERSPYESLEEAIEQAEQSGIDRKLAQEIGYLGGIKPVTAAKILTDPGGEPVAVFCKATGLKRHYLPKIWAALKRPVELGPGAIHPSYNRVRETYEMLSVAKAQTTLRYWNWSLSSDFQSRVNNKDAIDELTLTDSDRYSSSKRAARLVF